MGRLTLLKARGGVGKTLFKYTFNKFLGKMKLFGIKLEFKKALVPICIIYFFLLFSFGLIQPYFTLQLRTLGLTLDDAALIGESLALTYSSLDSNGC